MIEKVGFSSEDIKDFELLQEGGQVRWKTDVPQERDIKLDGAELIILRDGLKKLDKEEKLTPQHITLYEKIVE